MTLQSTSAQHEHDLSTKKASGDCSCIVGIVAGQDLRSIGQDVADGRCDKCSIILECHMGSIARACERCVRAVVHYVLDMANNGCSLSLTLPPFTIV